MIDALCGDTFLRFVPVDVIAKVVFGFTVTVRAAAESNVASGIVRINSENSDLK